MEDTIKILVVDDEPLARLRISSFDLEKHGFKVVGEAENGSDALVLIPVLKPDIIVTDIVMPVMDGLQLLTEVQQLKDAPKVVLLTCYDDFSKAQSALRLGAVDYIVKIMLKEEDFIDAINKAARAIQKEKQAVRKAVRKTLNDLILAGFREYYPEYLQQLSELGFGADLYRFILIDMEQARLQTMDAHKFSIERWDGDLRCIVVNMLPKCWTVLLYTEEDMTKEVFEQRTNLFCEKLLEDLGSTGRGESPMCRIIAGNPGRELSLLTDACNSIGIAQKLLYYTGPEEPFIPENKVEGFFNNMPGTVFQTYIDRFRENFISSNGKGAADCLIGWVHAVREEYRPLPEEVKIMASLFSACIPENISWDGVSLQQRMKAEIEASRHISGICRIFEEAAAYLAANLKSSEQYIRAEIRKALEYVHEQYKKDLSLEMVAEHVRLSASWFGNLFRTEMRQTFSEYLAAYRMAEARKLLEQTNMAVSQVAEEIGINDPHYFSRLFTKFMGQSPKEYRNSLRG